MPFEIFVFPGVICLIYAFFKATNNIKSQKPHHDD